MEFRVADRAVPIVTISGPPGVGKSALAVRVGHALELYETGQADEAATHFRTALELATAAEHAKGAIAALTGLALATRDPDPARCAVALAEQARFVALQGEAHNALARLSLADGRAGDAAAHAERAIAIHPTPDAVVRWPRPCWSSVWRTPLLAGQPPTCTPYSPPTPRARPTDRRRTGPVFLPRYGHARVRLSHAGGQDEHLVRRRAG